MAIRRAQFEPQRPRRNERGLATIVLILGLAFFVVGVLGVFGFEVTRSNAARQELQHVCEAAALAAAAAYPTPFEHSKQPIEQTAWVDDDDQIRAKAEKAAQQMFVSNSILQTWLSDVTFSDSRDSNFEAAHRANPEANQANMYIDFLNKDGVVADWKNGRFDTRVRVVGAYGSQPLFAKFCGIGKVVVYGEATAPVPWIRSWHSDWTWIGLGSSDWTDAGLWKAGSLADPTDPNATVTVYDPWVNIVNIPEVPGGYLTDVQFKQRYGYFQVVAKFPPKSWAKAWLSSWQAPAGAPQFDIANSYGGNNNVYYGVLHQAAGPGDVTVSTPINAGTDLTTGWHAYGLMWPPRKPDVYFMLDGKVVGKAKKFANTDSELMNVVIGNAPDTVYGTSTGGEPPAQFMVVDTWQTNAEFNDTNWTQGPL